MEKQIPVVPDKTLFRVGSVSKLFTATAVMQLAEQGLVNLDDDVNKYLKLFQIENNYPKPVTIANLLTHTGGFDERFIGMAARSASEVVPLGQYLSTRMPPRVLPPGDVMSYSNHGVALAGYLVEEISGIPFTQYIDENILQPLGMYRSSFLLPPNLAPDLAVGYKYKKGTYQPLPFDYLNNIAPAGSLNTTATDIARFMIAHLQDGYYGNARILKKTTTQEMHQQHFTHHPRLPGSAYGFYEHFENNQRGIKHSGGWRGFSSFLFLLPEQSLGFFVSYNKLDPKLSSKLVKEFLDHCYLTQEIPPQLLTDCPDRVRRFSGSYQSNRYARRTIEKSVTLFSQVHVTAQDNGALSTPNPLDPENPIRWVEVGPLLFRRVDEDGYAAGREDNHGYITHLFGKGPFAFEKLPWYATKIFHLNLIGLFVLVFLSGCILSLLSAVGLQSPSVHQLPQLLAGLVCTLDLVFLTGLILAFLLIDQFEFTYGMPPAVISLLFIPLLTSVLKVGLPIFAVLAWTKGYWSLVERLHYSLISLAALGFIPFLRYWNLLGLRF